MTKNLLGTFKRSLRSITIPTASTITSPDKRNTLSTPRRTKKTGKDTTEIMKLSRKSTFSFIEIPSIVNNRETPEPTDEKITLSQVSASFTQTAYQNEIHILSVEYHCPKCKATRDSQVSLIEILWYLPPCDHNHDDSNQSSTDSDGETTINHKLSKNYCENLDNSEYSAHNYDTDYTETSGLLSLPLTEGESEASVQIDCKAFGLDAQKFKSSTGLGMKSDKVCFDTIPSLFHTY